MHSVAEGPASVHNLHILFTQIARLYFTRNYTLLEKLEVHPGQVPLLFHLEWYGEMSQKELVDKLLVKPPTVAVMIKRMEKSGFVSRRRDDKDQRITRIGLTQKGVEILRQVEQALETVENECFQGFTPEDKEGSARLLGKIRNNLSAACRDTHPLGCCELTGKGDGDAQAT